jgi:hypothetical protein
MTGRLDWKWIAIGALIMVALNFVASLLIALVLREQLEGVTEPEAIQLTGGQAAIVAVVSFLSFAIGGYIVGIKSVGRTIIEPGISAAIAVLVGLLISGGFSVLNLVVGGLVPFLAGVIGGWLGERHQKRPGPA